MAIFLDLEFFSHLITSSFLEGSVSAEKLKNKVNYIYISQEESPIGNSFCGFGLFSLNREQLEIIKLLRRLENYRRQSKN